MDFELVRIEPVEVIGPAALLAQNLMSPFVWRSGGESDDGAEVLVRATPPDRKKDGESGRIWYGRVDPDGLTFRMQGRPLITPGPDADDIRGCEDPTVVRSGHDLIVYYTGVEKGGDGHLCYVAGRDVEHLTKHGVAHKSTKSERNTKEATVLHDSGVWRLLFEYAEGGHSKIGLGFGDDPNGDWTEQPDPITARPDKWDRWHLSTGPLLRSDPERPVMFYNGADKDADWGIGWAAFTRDLKNVVERCDTPVIAPPKESRDGRDIAFAASLLTRGDEIWLYFTKNDRELFRATLRQV